MTSLIRYDPVYDVLRPVDVFESLLSPVGALETLPALSSRVESLGNLPLDIYETDKELVVEASLPGFTKEDIQIEEHEGILTIRAEHEEVRKEEGENWLIQERAYQHFERSVPLPVEVRADKAEAVLEDGILRITFPKVHEGEGITHRIKIRAPKLKLPKLGKKEGKVKVKKG